MSAHTPAQWLVAYDIANVKRLGRMHRLMKKHGIPLQYSVFIVNANAVQMGALMAKVSKLIDSSADDVRAYCLPKGAARVSLGAAMLPEDLWLDAPGS